MCLLKINIKLFVQLDHEQSKMPEQKNLYHPDFAFALLASA